MKKLLCLALTLVMLFSFAACGGKGDSDGDKGAAGDVKIEFKAEEYTVEVGGYITFSELLTVTPADTKLTYTSSDTSVASLFTPSKGEFEGLKAGEVTITAATKDGKVSDTCTLTVVGMGTVVGRSVDEATGATIGGIANKYFTQIETPDDYDARIIIISKNIAEGTDMTDAVNLNYGEPGEDGSAAAAYANSSYFVAKTGTNANYTLEKVPAGDYIGIIISSFDYTKYKNYDLASSVAKFKNTEIAKYFTDLEIDALVEQFYNSEFFVDEFTVTAMEETVFGHIFKPGDEK